MKVAVISESSADEAAVIRLAEAVLATKVEIVAVKVRHRGWPNVCQAFPNLLREIFYATAADGVVLVVDSDFSPVHLDDHQPGDPDFATCRICQLNQAAATVLSSLK